MAGICRYTILEHLFFPEFYTGAYQYVFYPFTFFFSFFWRCIIFSLLRSIRKLLNFHFEHWFKSLRFHPQDWYKQLRIKDETCFTLNLTSIVKQKREVSKNPWGNPIHPPNQNCTVRTAQLTIKPNRNALSTTNWTKRKHACSYRPVAEDSCTARTEVRKNWSRDMAQAVTRRPLTEGQGSHPGQSMWDLWWTLWHWVRFFLRLLVSPVNIIPPWPHTHMVAAVQRHSLIPLTRITLILFRRALASRINNVYHTTIRTYN
jgi:hypothetical protein